MIKGKGGNRWQWELWRDGKLIKTWEHGNIYTAEGYNYLLSAGIAGGTQVTTWYVALLKVNHIPASTDTYANSMGTANYESTDYSESSRPTWQPGTVANQSVDNSVNKASFTMGGTDTALYGTGLVSVSTKGDSGTGKLLAIGLFSTSVTGIQSGDIIKVTTTCTLTD